MTHAEICARLPHAGRMCLLERLERWDGESIVCLAISHRDPGNPLRSHECLPAVCGVEYAAQAMALHASLLAPADTPPRAGFLASVRDLSLNVARLDDVAADLQIEARRLGDSADGFMYSFAVHAAGRPLLAGRAMVKLMNAEHTT
jgi:predicted hotdog family 3-hydroxylacyl-ACP dehydratase